MEAQLQAQLDRIDRSLSQLTRSISSYNPSHEHAKDLLTANSLLNSSITELATHQRNHQHLQSLRSTSSSLDVQLTTNLRALVELRASIRKAPLHAAKIEQEGNKARTVSVKEIIDYGLVAAKFLPPANFKPPSVLRREEEEAAAAAAAAAAGGVLGASGDHMQGVMLAASPEGSASPMKLPTTAVASPEPFTPGALQAIGSENTGDSKGQEAELNAGLKVLTEAEHRWLDPSKETPYVPWLSEQIIQESALKLYQGNAPDVLRKMKAEEEAAIRTAEAAAKKKANAEALPTDDTWQAAPTNQQQAGTGAPQDTKAVFGGWDDED